MKSGVNAMYDSSNQQSKTLLVEIDMRIVKVSTCQKDYLLQKKQVIDDYMPELAFMTGLSLYRNIMVVAENNAQNKWMTRFMQKTLQRIRNGDGEGHSCMSSIVSKTSIDNL